MQILAIKDEEFYEGMGVYFVGFALNLGYADVLISLGRNLRDMLLNLDNLHDYLRTTFPRIKPPSFFIEEESETRMKIMQFLKYARINVIKYLSIAKLYFRHEATVSKQEKRISFLRTGTSMINSL